MAEQVSPDADWVVLGPGANQAECRGCGRVEKLPTNCTVPEWVGFVEDMVARHGGCRPLAGNRPRPREYWDLRQRLIRARDFAAWRATVGTTGSRRSRYPIQIRLSFAECDRILSALEADGC